MLNNENRAPDPAPLFSLDILDQPVTRSTTLLPRSLIASTPATTADPACCATPCATRVTRAIGVDERDDVPRLALLLEVPRAADELLPPAALREEALLPALRFELLLERPLAAALDRREPALRVLLEALAADLPIDFFRFAPDLLAVRDEAFLPDFPRDFLALVAIDASPRVVD